jgi:hypothetical protein
MTELYAEVVRQLDGGDPVARDDVQRWIESGDLLTWSAVYELINVAYDRITPELGDETLDFARRYLLRCIEENPTPGDLLHGGFEAAWELAAALKHWRAVGGKATEAIVRGVVIDLEKLYRRADAATRSRVLCGVLEHAFEDPALRHHFAHWSRGDEDVRDAYQLAMEWGEAHEGGN